MSKLCTLCNINKQLDDFGKHKQMKDGHLNQCRMCKNDYLRKYGQNNKEKFWNT